MAKEKADASAREKDVQEAAARLRAAQSDDDPVGDLEASSAMPPTDVIAFIKENLPGVDVAFEYTSESQALIAEVCNEFRDFLIAKNEQYGDSAIDPVRIFSQSNPEEQLKVRMDDKLSRLMRGDDSLEPDDDIMKDMLGYWVLLHVVKRKAARADAE